MAPEVLPLADDTWYMLRRLATQRRSTVEAVITDLIRAEYERTRPGSHENYERRAQIAEQILERRGIDPADTDYQRAAVEARALLDQVDAIFTGPNRPGPG